MAVVVVPLGTDEVGALTLQEWDELRACERVVFERPDHPLIERLRAHGVEVGTDADDVTDGWGLVAEPGSPRIVDLAKAGAVVTSGAARSPDALTAAHGSSVARRATAALGEAALVMARLRSPDGCPWDHEQTHQSLEVHLVEETHEVLDAIDRGALETELEEELGDVLLQVLFHAQMAADDGRFDIEGVAGVLTAKLVRRHPHVFGDVSVAGASEVVANWETIKAAEKQQPQPGSGGRQSERSSRSEDRFADLPVSLPALLAAYKTQKRAAGLGWDAPAPEALERLRSATDALHEAAPTAASLGELLFWAVAVARAAGLDPESALRRATLHFKQSF